eukprot:CCRYP_000070-RH/>CCRYP_000070-RH protein AED:0.32 eAED:0.32 QI:0/0/0/1/0/0/2/0/196
MSPIPKWSAKSARKKLTLTAHASPSEATASGTLATVGPKRAHWKPSNSFSIAFFPHLPHVLHHSISPTSTLAHHSTDQSMPASNSPIFLTTLSKNTASTTLHTMVMFTSKSPKALPQPLVFGDISGDQSCLSSSTMTLASNIPTADMLSTSCRPYNNITQSPLTGQAPSLQALTSNRTTTNEPAASPWTPTFPPCY